MSERNDQSELSQTNISGTVIVAVLERNHEGRIVIADGKRNIDTETDILAFPVTNGIVLLISEPTADDEQAITILVEEIDRRQISS